MYANRDTAVPVVPVVPVRPQRGLAALPILALCCLLFILFIIAATIVLALIPIYLQTAQASRRSSSSTRFATAQVPGTLPDGTIDANSRTSLANSIAAGQGLPSGSVTVTNGVVSSNGGRRKRRALLARSERQTFKTLTFSYVYNLVICGGSCTTAVLISVAITLTQVTLTVGGITITITTLSISVTATTITAGPTVSSTTTTVSTASTSSTSTSTTAAQTTPFVG